MKQQTGARIYLEISSIKKRKILNRLRGIQSSNKYTNSLFLQNLEESSIKEYNLLLKSEEGFWKLRSRINWLHEGDANTNFFSYLNIKQEKRKKIITLKLEDGNWGYDPEEIMHQTTVFFNNLFQTSRKSSYLRQDHTTSTPPNVDLTLLDQDLTDKEIWEAVFFFQSNMAPGPNGIHPFFYQKYWEKFGPSVKSFCREAWSKGTIDPSTNTTHICLIPKSKSASSSKNFRPISLCNRLIKY